jgi:hypothetical protein
VTEFPTVARAIAAAGPVIVVIRGEHQLGLRPLLPDQPNRELKIRTFADIGGIASPYRGRQAGSEGLTRRLAGESIPRETSLQLPQAQAVWQDGG